VLKNPNNLGYGGNQKLGYTYALDHGFDAVVLLHGDGQYAPEILEDLITPIARDEADVVLGSRMLVPRDALRGGMPLYKYVGNRILTMAQNRLLDSALSEFHTGYRVFRTALLRKLPFTFNDDGFAFDTDILIQCLDTRARIVEQPIPTFYGSEVCRVNGMRYAWQVFSNTIRSRLHHLGLFSDPRFEYTHMSPYESKLGFDSSHEYVFRHIPPGSVVLDIGCGSGAVAAALKADKHCTIHGIDHLDYRLQDTLSPFASFQVIDLDHQPLLLLDAVVEQLDVVLLLDVIEHLNHPEAFLLQLRRLFDGRSVRLILTTGNVGFLSLRLGLLLGQFNYGRRGILDHTHKRLFTFSSLTRMLKQHGYTIEHRSPIPVPFPLFCPWPWLAALLLKLNHGLSIGFPALFGFQIAVVARPRPSIPYLLAQAQTQTNKAQNLDVGLETLPVKAPGAQADA
ncbi:MAG: methyltransferase domain-containing protein, partial [Cyanobacteria bacterium HKST-UBA06]|nr:methyltransferase domain-containing protein [Cyanobacteria bacterium HKST-UBA06]